MLIGKVAIRKLVRGCEFSFWSIAFQSTKNSVTLSVAKIAIIPAYSRYTHVYSFSDFRRFPLRVDVLVVNLNGKSGKISARTSSLRRGLTCSQ